MKVAMVLLVLLSRYAAKLTHTVCESCNIVEFCRMVVV